MAGELTTKMLALAGQLGAACPTRIVGRDFLPLAQRTDEELLDGVITVVSQGEMDYANYRGREAQLGRVLAVLVGQLRVADNDPRSALEDAEFAMAEEIKAWLASPPSAPLEECLATGFRQSGQLEHPYGWVVFELEVR